MAKKIVKNYTLYKIRFWLGYGILALAISAVLITGALHTPGGITSQEEASVIISSSLSINDPSTALIVDLPYHALQKLSIAILGLTTLSIKLPSLIIAALSIAGLMLAMKRRFAHTVGILAVGIVVVSAKFISISTTGTPEIMKIFWPVVFLLVAVYGVREKKLTSSAIAIGALSLGLSLFTPFSIYAIAALLIGASLHPRTRYLLRQTPKSALLGGALISIAGIATMAYTISRDPTIIPRLTYKSDSFSLDIIANLKSLGLQLGDITSSSISSTGLLAPVVGLSVATIGLLGVYALIRARHTLLSYTLFSWTLLLTPFFIVNPDSFSLLIVPIALFVALGIGLILQYWYSLFPKNPYARIFALIPTSILFSCIIIPSAFHFFYSYSYFAPLANKYHNDLTLVTDTLTTHSSAALAVTAEQEAFYRIYLDANNIDNQLISIDPSKPPVKLSNANQTVVATMQASRSISITPTYIVAGPTLHTDSDRFYIYKISQK